MGTPRQPWGSEPPSEQVHAVQLTRGFWIQQHETTIAEWRSVGFADTPEESRNWGRQCREANCPVDNIMWFEAVALANALSEREQLEPCYILSGCGGKPGEKMTCTGVELTAPTVYECKGYRLPTQSEWEYAARAGTRTVFFTGDLSRPPNSSVCYEEPVLESIAWYCNNSDRVTHPVEQKLANAWGLFDVIGNVAEWTHDAEGPWPKPVLYTDPGGELGELARARSYRNGNIITWPWGIRTSWRSYTHSTDITLGTRLARTDWGAPPRALKR
jgi:formylglycine-generating enzyme required for sulfatase activity